MQIVFFSEDLPQGQTADWPVIPRVGDIVQHSLSGGETTQKVEQVVFHANADSSFHSVTVHLSY